MSRASMPEVRAGLVVVAALGALLALVAVAGGGPGFLASRKRIEVVFRDGQGIRSGSLVRISGLNAGRVEDVDLVEVDGSLKARVTIALPANLAARLRQDVKITIQASLTGESLVNIVDSGRSGVALVPGQRIQGVESSFFDPVLEQVGLGPVERSHLSHTIAEVRKTVDSAGPQMRQILGGLQDTVAHVRETAEATRPAIETAAARVEELSRRIDPDRFDQTLARLDRLTVHAEGLLAENRPTLKEALGNVKELTHTLRLLAAQDGPKLAAMMVKLDGTRARLDEVLVQAGTLAGQGNDLLAHNRANLDRTFANVRDASDFGVKLVGKLYGNPFYLSPFYKPTREDVRAQEVYDAASTFLLGAKELNDTINRMMSLRTKPLEKMTPTEMKAYQDLFNRAYVLQNQLDQSSRRLAEGLREPPRR